MPLSILDRRTGVRICQAGTCPARRFLQRRQVRHMFPKTHLCEPIGTRETVSIQLERSFLPMKAASLLRKLRAFGLAGLLVLSVLPLLAAPKNWALVTASGNKLQEVSMVELTKLCKGTQKTWPDGRSFTLVIHDPESPEMRGPIQKLFGVAPPEVKPLLAKLNESRHVIRIVESDEDLLRIVGATPGAVGLVNVYT